MEQEEGVLGSYFIQQDQLQQLNMHHTVDNSTKHHSIDNSTNTTNHNTYNTMNHYSNNPEQANRLNTLINGQQVHVAMLEQNTCLLETTQLHTEQWWPVPLSALQKEQQSAAQEVEQKLLFKDFKGMNSAPHRAVACAIVSLAEGAATSSPRSRTETAF
jgi:hypothetical protein